MQDVEQQGQDDAHRERPRTAPHVFECDDSLEVKKDSGRCRFAVAA
jgi:hypothetical protein